MKITVERIIGAVGMRKGTSHSNLIVLQVQVVDSRRCPEFRSQQPTNLATGTEI